MANDFRGADTAARGQAFEGHAPRVWFITGASSGIGRELAIQALASGEAVIAVARHTETLAGLVTGPRSSVHRG
ncbi:SDR family NAD(P)-dependent oxidoreductase [Nocardia nepalensis]|uniref:SDR family NAD(P)-dependent oxidoreductase n=1 Tax=Nocardia nepalensis TaxID=3375448 RepID=UPI003B673790